MNPIKFRVWKEGVTKGLEMYSWQEVQESDMNQFFSNPKCNIMLFTGLHDRNGNEIYVGDLVYYGEEEILYEVMINDFLQIPVIDCDLGQEKLYKCHKQVRVSGNIYEGFTAQFETYSSLKGVISCTSRRSIKQCLVQKIVR